MAFVQLPTPLKTYRVVGGSTKASQLTQGLTFFFSLLNYDRKITHCNKIVVSTCPFMVPGMIIQLCCQNNFISCSTSDLDLIGANAEVTRYKIEARFINMNTGKWTEIHSYELQRGNSQSMLQCTLYYSIQNIQCTLKNSNVKLLSY